MPSLLRVRALVRVGLAGVLLIQAALVAVAVWATSPLLFALGEIALVSTVGCCAIVIQYARLRSRFIRERLEMRREWERRRLADDVHDLVGHELSLIAMQAGLIELRTEGETARQVADLRERTARAVHALHDTIVLMTDHDRPEPALGERRTSSTSSAHLAGR